ncbi:MAG: hydrolase [Pseudomonadota bacterium]
MSSPPQVIRSRFRPARWLSNRHAQTVFTALPWAYRKRPPLIRSILDLPDGDATAVDWLASTHEVPGSAPLLVILHGLESSAESAYARMLMEAAEREQWRCCVLHFRDCGDYRNRLPRRYHAGETGDIRYFLGRLRADGQTGPMLAAGYSLGGNVLLKYLGETGDDSLLSAAAAVCVPLDLHQCADALTQGLSKLYQRHLIKRMKNSVMQKFDQHTAAFDWNRAMAAQTFAEFDDAVTAPLHGFDGKNDYYDRCSSVHFLKGITRPTLIVNALDDPFMTPGVIPHRDRLSPSITLEVSEAGGHVGFISGGYPWKPEFYLPGRVLEFLTPHSSTET